ncbi:acyltransferase family protein [Clostridium carnis]
MESKKERNYSLDNLKVMLIFTVVFGHVIEYYIKDSVILKGIYIFIYIFHMPLFIFISGYFSKNFKKMKRKSIRNLLIPYIIFNMIWYGAVYIGTNQAMFSVLYPGWTLWYLLSLFFWRMSLKYIIKFKYILPLSFITGLVIGILPHAESILSVSRTIVFLPFFLLGYYANDINLRKIQGFSKLLSILGILIFAGIALYVADNNLLNYKFFYNSQSYSSFELNIVEGIAFRALLYIGAILFSICIINLIPRKITFFTYIGTATMNIYVFHIYLVLLVYFFVPKWNMSIIGNIAIILSPIFIIYILARKRVNKVYSGILYPVDKGIDTGKKSWKKFKFK